MFLKSLSLIQFRNYAGQDVSLAPQLNLIVGSNGSGKSNLIEAVSVLATGRSHRGADAKHLLQWEKDGFSLKGTFEGEECVTLEIRQRAGRPRQILFNNVAQKRLRDWVGRIPVVSFSPDDLDMVKGEPAVRRRVLNAVLCQLDADYMESLQRYNKIVMERNAALRQVQEREQPVNVLDPWDMSLLKEGIFLSMARRTFLAEFSPQVESQHQTLAQRHERVRLHYKASLLLPDNDPETAFTVNRRRLQDLRDGEIALGSTLIGPHRDDLEIFMDDNPARAYASQGQQRTVALAVKLTEHDVISTRLRRTPICLLDDMLSELDASRRANLVEALSRQSQCLVSLTDLSEWPRIKTAAFAPRVFDVENGRLTAREETEE